jgi:hypothetical protein
VNKTNQNWKEIWAEWMSQLKMGINMDGMDDTRKRPGVA